MTDAPEHSYEHALPDVTDLDRRLAWPMFAMATLFLAFMGTAIHFAVDESGRYQQIVANSGWAMLALLPVFWIEFAVHSMTGGKWQKLHLWACVFPPFRLVTRDHVTGNMIWLPSFGWKTADDKLAEVFELKLGYPMIGVALLILPLLAIQQFKKDLIASNQQIGFWVQIAEVAIWQAFAMEFLIAISLVSKKVNFLKTHWLDAAIILLPLIAFLRAARIGRVFRLHQLSKLSKTARMFRFKGLAMRAWRAILVLEIVDRIIHRDPQKRLLLLREQLETKEQEVAILMEEIEKLELRIAEEMEKEAETSGASELN